MSSYSNNSTNLTHRPPPSSGRFRGQGRTLSDSSADPANSKQEEGLDPGMGALMRSLAAERQGRSRLRLGTAAPAATTEESAYSAERRSGACFNPSNGALGVEAVQQGDVTQSSGNPRVGRPHIIHMGDVIGLAPDNSSCADDGVVDDVSESSTPCLTPTTSTVSFGVQGELISPSGNIAAHTRCQVVRTIRPEVPPLAQNHLARTIKPGSRVLGSVGGRPSSREDSNVHIGNIYSSTDAQPDFSLFTPGRGRYRHSDSIHDSNSEIEVEQYLLDDDRSGTQHGAERLEQNLEQAAASNTISDRSGSRTVSPDAGRPEEVTASQSQVGGEQIESDSQEWESVAGTPKMD
ncbi:uncharacterized protein I303_101659 [Kwoniella dejecticola CBS 10117]|uniref:Uncharacterized protein n=1 Tax=Kwoniella dejecticola CBS 10117 TaxID=1296121 RepID=A0A1A6AD65_9TREE|nr:uncharacterized protein I303_02204 [Kwoniella dejecticola CBS 10117]OBR87988.1 hypothetical protein I303_02204 [Kwoniella dejecticola CBS 10117]